MFDHEDIIDVDAEGLIFQALNNPEQFAYCGFVPEGNVGIVIDTEWCGYYGVPEGDNLTAGELADSIADAEIFGNGDALGVNSTFQLQNIGSQKVSGFDMTYTQYIDTESAGRFTVLFDSTYLDKFERSRTLLSNTEQLAGSFRYPRIVASLKLRWSQDDLFGSISANYTHKYRDEIAELGELNADPNDPTDYDALDYIRDTVGLDAVPSPDRDVPSWTTVNMEFGKDFGDDITVRFGINNLFDEDAPFVYGRYLNADMLNHDVMGRYYRLTYTQRF
jgi:outer membrane receptor protein involved in Fe transport